MMIEQQRPPSFRLKLDVESEEESQPSAKSWKLQLLRLVQEAPGPIPVACTEPRRFPHFEHNRISESSWTSDTTRFTDITASHSSLLRDSKNLEEGINDTTNIGSEVSSSSKQGFKKNGKNDVDCITAYSKVESDKDIGIETSDEFKSGKELRYSHSIQQNQSNTDQHHTQDHQPSRNTLSLSVLGDSEYWEKFRHSRDYKSYMMIETICNEVFNLKPSPRYKSLMRLSKENKGKQRRPQELSQLQCDDVLRKDVEKVKTKEETKTIPFSRGEKNEHENFVKVEEVEKLGSTTRLSEIPRQKYLGAKRNDSTTSSVFTTTTEDENEHEYLRINERNKLLKGFGQAFHGYLTKHETERILQTDGQYLIRQMWNEDGFILSFRFDCEIKNFRIMCDQSGTSAGSNMPYTFYLEDRRKCYYNLDELVREGLITLYLNENAGSYIDLLVELAQFQQNDNLLQTSPAVSPASRKPSRSASLRVARLTSSSSVIASGDGGHTSDGNSIPSITVTSVGRNSMDIALRIHFFEEETFDRLAKCQICSRGLWGPSNKGLQCRDCSISIHETCIDNVKCECKPDLTSIPPFSTDLTTLVKGSCSEHGSFGPPYVLEKCINEIEAKGLSTEGIYRVSGSVEEIEYLKNLFEKEKVNADLAFCEDVHSITGLTKFFLRQLPDSLITTEVFEEFTRENQDEMTMETVQSLISCLPPAHRITLKYLLQHLQRVSKEKSSNKMNAFNLSSVLMPSVIGPTNMSFNVLELCTKLLHVMITHVNEFKF